MDMDLNITSTGQFTNYSAKSVTIQGEEYTKNILVYNDQISEFNFNHVKDVTFENLKGITDTNPDLIIFGTGNGVDFPDFKMLDKLNLSGIGFEVMPIPALCRTYNFLASENRKVACILFFEA